MSPWRRALDREFGTISIDGTILDIGGDSRSTYIQLLRGAHSVEIVNLDPATGAKHLFDVENPFPLADNAYDAVLCINLLEHIYNYKAFLAECRRVMKEDGSLVLAVPFLMQVHPSPHDHFRYTEESLRRIFEEAGFRNIRVLPVGRGPFTAASHVTHNVLAKIPFLARAHAAVSGFFDSALALFDTKGTFGPTRYPLGYLVRAGK